MTRRTVRLAATYVGCAVAGMVAVGAGCLADMDWTGAYLLALLIALTLGTFVRRLP